MATKERSNMDESLRLLSNHHPETRNVRSPWRRCCYTIGHITNIAFVFNVVVLVLFCFFNFLDYGLSLYRPDFPSVSAPGIGISLSHHTASIVIHSSNGTATNLAHIPAPPCYTSLLKRLSQASARRPAPPYNPFKQAFRQWHRTARRTLGWPASEDVGIMAEVLQKCADVVKAHGVETNGAVAVVPNALALYAEDVQDAFEYIGWRALSGHNVDDGMLRALPAAYAGYRFGLCQRPEDFETCVEEEGRMRRRGVMIVDGGMGVLATDARVMDTPMYVFNEEYATLDWDAGDNDEQRVVLGVRRAVESLVIRGIEREPGEGFVDEVFIVGEETERLKSLEDIVRTEVDKVQSMEARIWSDDPGWVVARGAAELARRIIVQRGRVV